MVDGGERVGASWGGGDEAIGSRGMGIFEEAGEEGHGQAGHIASDDEIPVGFGAGKGSFEAGERAQAGAKVGDNGAAGERVAPGRGDESDIAGGLKDGLEDGGEDGLAGPGQEGFIAAHAGTAPARQHKTALPHGRIIPLTVEFTVYGRQVNLYNRENKLRYICFILGVAAIAGNGWAADNGSNQDAVRTVVKVDARSGRLVRKVVVPRPAAKKLDAAAAEGTEQRVSGDTRHLGAGDAIGTIVEESARAHNVDPLLVHSVIEVESDYNLYALSPKGAEGLMQLIPATARRFGVTDSFDPRQNIEAGVKYLKYLQELFHDDRLALAAYNAGEGAVFKYKDIPPYRETEGYVQKVGKKLGEARARQKKAAAPAVDGEKPEERHPPLEQFTDAEGRVHLRTR